MGQRGTASILQASRAQNAPTALSWCCNGPFFPAEWKASVGGSVILCPAEGDQEDTFGCWSDWISGFIHTNLVLSWKTVKCQHSWGPHHEAPPRTLKHHNWTAGPCTFPLLCVRVHVTEAAVCGPVRYEKWFGRRPWPRWEPSMMWCRLTHPDISPPPPPADGQRTGGVWFSTS